MKNILLFVSMLAMTFAFVACSNEDDVVEQPVNTQSKRITIFACGENSTGGVAGAKTTRTQLESNYSVTWAIGDKILIGSNKFTLKDEYAGQSSGEFVGEENATLAKGTHDAFYGISEKVLPETQVYDAAKMVSHAPMYASVLVTGDGGDTKVTDAEGKPIVFKNLCGLLCLNIRKGDASANVKTITIYANETMTGAFCIDNDAASITLGASTAILDCRNGDQGVTLAADGTPFYIALPAKTYTGVEVVITDINDATYTKKFTSTPTIVRSKITKVSFTAGTFSSSGDHPYVDFKLPSGAKWATKNIGAESETDFGDYFEWGDVVTRSLKNAATFNFGDWSNYVFGFTGSFTNYNGTDHMTTLAASHDVATQQWGGAWRMPTEEEVNELLNYCEWEKAQDDKKNHIGYNVYKRNYNPDGTYTIDKTVRMFLPYARYYTGEITEGVRDDDWSIWNRKTHDEPKLIGSECGYYWSASLDNKDINNARCFYFSPTSSTSKVSSIQRNYGLTVRPVFK